VMAKGLSGGFPLAAVTGRTEVMDAPKPGGLGGTFAGNPLGIAAAHAVLDIIAEERLCERAITLGKQLKQRLETVWQDIPEIADVRGPGFMNAVEFQKAGSLEPNPEFANAVRAKALEHGLILLTCGVYGNVIRFLAPITIPQSVFEEALEILESSIRAVRKLA
jgi:4-aminobutyrate aminotransferase